MRYDFWQQMQECTKKKKRNYLVLSGVAAKGLDGTMAAAAAAAAE